MRAVACTMMALHTAAHVPPLIRRRRAVRPARIKTGAFERGGSLRSSVTTLRRRAFGGVGVALCLEDSLESFL